MTRFTPPDEIVWNIDPPERWKVGMLIAIRTLTRDRAAGAWDITYDTQLIGDLELADYHSDRPSHPGGWELEWEHEPFQFGTTIPTGEIDTYQAMQLGGIVAWHPGISEWLEHHRTPETEERP